MGGKGKGGKGGKGHQGSDAIEDIGHATITILRHNQILFNNKVIDEYGWMSMDDMLKFNHRCRRYNVRSVEELRFMLDADDTEKRRFSYKDFRHPKSNALFTCVRAIQGHSIHGIKYGGPGSVLDIIKPGDPRWENVVLHGYVVRTPLC